MATLATRIIEAMDAVYFETPSQWRAWLEANHDRAPEVWVGFHKVGSGRPSITWPESVDQALCFGWIDGLRKSLGEHSYMIRFTPRKPRSIWSAVNIKRVGELAELGLMHPAGLAAFEKRADDRSAIYAYEQRHSAALSHAEEELFRTNPSAWEFFQARPASYRKAAVYWVVSAKQAQTRARRLATLIEDSEAGRTIRPLTPPGVKRSDGPPES